jgi:aspartyl-tRNA(Asn)/glutamyl-tRNA(Gln) amidotransferase subunit A
MTSETTVRAGEVSPVDGLPLTITTAARELRSGRLSSVDLLAITRRRVELVDPLIGAFITPTHEQAGEAAQRLDEELAAGIDRGPLHGIPIGIKDIITTDDAPTTAQSLVLDRTFGDRGDAEVVRRLREAGAVVTGKTTTMEYALGAPDPSKGFPTPRNPFDLDRWPGGSSSGTGNGVVSGLFLAGLGTDTGGSVRLPASWSGISGLKPTFGLVPKSGCVPLAWSYDAIGPMARSARDCAAMLTAMAGYDPEDRTSVRRPRRDYATEVGRPLDGLRVGVDYSLSDDPRCDPEVARLFEEAVAVFETAGADVRPVRLPMYDEMTTVTAVGLGVEALAYHRRTLAAKWEDYGAPTRMAAAFAAMTSAADYVQSQRARRVGVRAAHEVFDDVDVLVHATCLLPPPLVDGLSFDSIVSAINTRYWNALGFPAISIPMGLTAAGLPVGMHIGGRPFEDGTVLRVAAQFQERTNHHLVEPPLVTEVLGQAGVENA